MYKNRKNRKNHMYNVMENVKPLYRHSHLVTSLVEVFLILTDINTKTD